MFHDLQKQQTEINEWVPEYIQIILATSRLLSDHMHKCLLTFKAAPKNCTMAFKVHLKNYPKAAFPWRENKF